MGLGQILSYATRRIKPNQIRIRKRELDASNNRSFASEFVSSEYDFTALMLMCLGHRDSVPPEMVVEWPGGGEDLHTGLVVINVLEK